MICPCQDCEKKGCGVYHDICEKYQKYVEHRKYTKKREREESEKIYNVLIAKRIRKINKKQY